MRSAFARASVALRRPGARSQSTVLLMRHGESTWNLENKFTGWYDCPLSDKGHVEAADAGALVAEAGLAFDVAYTSTLKRAIRTLDHALEQSDHMWIPVTKAWQLNERHYGALQGRKRVIHRRFNVNVPRARVSETAPTLRERSER